MELATAPSTPRKPDPDTEEVRVAMALNGGVSLAVWMGGCAVELDCARRADKKPRGYGSLYHTLCEGFSRKLVIDIMSGSSAGGINGALLAAAISHGRQIPPDYMRERWLKLGDLSKLLHTLSTAGPTSLMNGKYFHDELVATFHVLLGTTDEPDQARISEPDADAAPDAFPPVLNVTTTDLGGTELEFRDTWGDRLTAHRYQACFRFREPCDFSAENLATAARASASFPIAFEPWEVRGTDPLRLAGFKGPRWVVDGGLLDNAPIRLALKAIPTRPAVSQVRRFVCYVNAEPLEPPPDDRAPEPDLARIAGAIVNLPRKAPFADELGAIQQASRRSELNRHAEIPLLALDRGCLRRTADALLPPYRRSRRQRSLLDLLPQPADAQAAFGAIEEERYELPWVPTTLDPPERDAWGWGILAALRVHHLMLDLIGAALEDTADEHDRVALLEARMEIDGRAQKLRERQAAFSNDPCVIARLKAIAALEALEDVERRHRELEDELAALTAYTVARDRRLSELVRETAQTVLGVAGQLGAREQVQIGGALFGEAGNEAGPLSGAMFRRFLERVLAIEVIRRAFSAEEEIDQAQPIKFAQLTPYAPTPLLSKTPVSKPKPGSPEDKLAGLLLGHFGGFYRGSWRANDFMWGRLDSASRIVALLIDTDRTRPETPGLIADALVVSAAGHEPLLENVLSDASLPPAERAGKELGDRLESAIRADLGRDGELTRVLCTVAAQLEIVQTELPVVLECAAKDEGAGSSLNQLDDLPGPAELRTPEGLDEAIAALRGAPSLPRRLGVGAKDERASDLAVRTISRSGLVLLSVLRGAGAHGLPFATPLQAARGVLLPVAGVVAEHKLSRAVGALAFWAASMFLAARLITTTGIADAGELSPLELLVTLVAILVVAGTAGPALYRLVRGGRAGRGVQLLWVIALLASGVGAAIGFALAHGRSPAQLIVQPHAEPVPSELLWAVVFVVFGVAPLARVIRPRAKRLADSAWSKGMALLTSAVAGLLVIWAFDSVTEALDGALWHKAIAIAALFAAPAVALLYVFGRTPIDRWIVTPVARRLAARRQAAEKH